uniref:Cation/H+ exchanger transmembrane domain-containing protein n=1 Tax=Magnetococcus massalia (strain MO-1) TaxID=451514 RepID=A0A1S7LNT9_MAGMO|nr:Protein of unknown function. putative suger transporter [Candidatus Magnetococcus massalia]
MVDTHQPAHLFVTLGGLFILGLLSELLGRRMHLPRVSLLILLGVLLGPVGVEMIHPQEDTWLLTAADAALLMVGFLLGEKFSKSTLERYGRQVVLFSIYEVVVTVILVGMGLYLLGVPAPLALLLCGIATATAPAATVDVVRELEAEGPFARTLLGIVALDDALGLVIFSLLISVVEVLHGGQGFLMPLLKGVWEIGGAILLGIVASVGMGFALLRSHSHEASMVITIGSLSLAGGLAFYSGVSFLLTSMTMGMVMVNTCSQCFQATQVVERIIWPFMILLFVFGGASMQLDALMAIGWMGAAYITLRMIARFVASWMGGWHADASPHMTRWMGLALMPQAGVALGMALIAGQRFPELRDLLMAIVVGSTVFFELVGPLMTRRALVLAGEAGRARKEEREPTIKKRRNIDSAGSARKRKLGEQRKS